MSEVIQTRLYASCCRVARSFYSPSTGFALLFYVLVRMVRQWCVKTRAFITARRTAPKRHQGRSKSGGQNLGCLPEKGYLIFSQIPGVYLIWTPQY